MVPMPLDVGLDQARHGDVAAPVIEVARHHQGCLFRYGLADEPVQSFELTLASPACQIQMAADQMDDATLDLDAGVQQPTAFETMIRDIMVGPAQQWLPTDDGVAVMALEAIGIW